MPKLALALCGIWFLLLFAFRSFLLWRQTGSTGIKGFHGEFGSLEWIAGASTTLGLLFAPLAPIAVLRNWWLGELLLENPTIHAIGAVLAVLGILGALNAQSSMGRSWRIGVDETERTDLVTERVFALVRNPIFSFIGLSLLGFTLMVPNTLALLAMTLAAIGIELQVRFVEEPYLRNVHGEKYIRYSARVGRFVPGVGRVRSL